MTESKITQHRLLSLDTLRGFDMFWIIGGDILFRTLGKLSDQPVLTWWGTQMEHVEWKGFHAYDLVFPLFMFIAGVTIPYALLQKLEKGVSKTSLYPKIFKRAVILIIFGFIYNGFLQLDVSTFRYASVLGQIGIAYLLASLIMLNTKSMLSRIFWFAGILGIYALIQLIVPVPGFGPGVFTPEGIINGYIDRIFLPGSLYGGTFDPEGLLCIVSATGITLLGALCGLILLSKQYRQYSKVLILVIGGIVLIILGSVLNTWYPVIKSAWTTTFNLLAGGISMVLLGVFYLVIDVWKFQGWTLFFRVIGLNSITIYMATCFVPFWEISQFFLGGLARLSGTFEPVIIILGVITVEWLFLYFLYKKRIFLKV
ncbi:MAG: DUF5009 domain-containing protein [Bacteroidales bacterium]|nr:DUF5009 domain-containing protein [Bacteroidales bacterium]